MAHRADQPTDPCADMTNKGPFHFGGDRDR